MSLTQTLPYFLAVIAAAGLDILANLMLTKSNGFKIKKYGICAIVLVLLAFSSLSIAIKRIDLSVAYAMWGSFGILGTSLGGWALFGNKLKPVAWAGIFVLVIGIILLKSS